MNVSCARQQGKAVWIYILENFVLKIRIQRTFFLDSGKKWAIVNGKCAD